MKKKMDRKKALLRGITVEEVSSVGGGANQGAIVSLLKTDSMDEIFKASFADVLGQMEVRDEVAEIFDKIWEYSSALRESLYSILEDVNEPNKKDRMRESINQFVLVMGYMIEDSDVIKSDDGDLVPLFKSFTSDIWKHVLTTPPDNMGDFRSLQATVREAFQAFSLDKQLPDAFKKTQEEVKMEKFYKTMALMNDAQKQAYNDLSKEDQEELLKLEPEAIIESIQKGIDDAADPDPIDKSDDNDESFMMGDQKVLKSVVGDGPFLILKAQQKQLDDSKVREDKLAKSLGNERQLRVEKEAADEAEARWPNLPGTALEKGRTLIAINKLDPAVRDAQLKMLDSGNEGNSNLFKENGHQVITGDPTAGEALNKLANDRSKDTGESFAKAYDHVIQTAEGKALYEKTLN